MLLDIDNLGGENGVRQGSKKAQERSMCMWKGKLKLAIGKELSTICARRKLRELTTEVLNSEPQVSVSSHIKLDGISRC